MTKLSTELKICGITQTKQAIEIASLGVNAIGVIGVKNSPRFISAQKRTDIFDSLGNHYPKIKRVLVVADIDDSDIEGVLSQKATPTVFQLHGNESTERIKTLRERYPEVNFWKAFRIRTQEDIESIHQYESIVEALLLDAWSEKQLGGTGNRITLQLIKDIKFKVPWWLAGGISAEWIPQVLSLAKPFGIDASSKLEISPGVKDINKVKSLIKSLKNSQK